MMVIDCSIEDDMAVNARMRNRVRGDGKARTQFRVFENISEHLVAHYDW